ncbi:unnamed protein product [Vitrella brassicaformis CCMP3155]|uniref:Uncharacterized protein n=1 Tax=Vitrella brassicaformis (strain CCMP3155) TaxID=1169540 RepID=A0A0G4EQ01_VITBC|nr:unnamed protein product [Vitrella brassicaformis CCMP3155]|mmetsp:Transcript_49760/g.124799  ORF Transcript_49760/g.124799 Transcript_49760/m.124799 type:complete len:245 (+) Transcript_49760:1028-1762(+)|eukprot:CEL99365.1 unnamed protein product [Vitrella brassicaformis CCMP3155]
MANPAAVLLLSQYFAEKRRQREIEKETEMGGLSMSRRVSCVTPASRRGSSRFEASRRSSRVSVRGTASRRSISSARVPTTPSSRSDINGVMRPITCRPVVSLFSSQTSTLPIPTLPLPPMLADSDQASPSMADLPKPESPHQGWTGEMSTYTPMRRLTTSKATSKEASRVSSRKRLSFVDHPAVTDTDGSMSVSPTPSVAAVPIRQRQFGRVSWSPSLHVEEHPTTQPVRLADTVADKHDESIQ